MTDEERVREFCDLMAHEKVTPESYAGRVLALLTAVRADATKLEREECALTVNALDAPDDSSDSSIGIAIGLSRAEAAIRARKP